MGWQKGYYYRKKWVDGHVRSVYMGRGFAGARAASEDEEARVARAQVRAVLTEAISDERSLADVEHDIKDFTASVLLVTGHHRHRRQWRRNRDRSG